MDFDALRYIGAVTRRIETREYEGRPARVLVATCAYDTSVADLWDAVTNPERIPRWFLPITSDLRPGGRYQLQGNAGGSVTACDPPHRFALTWEFGGQVSWVEVSLTATSDGGALLRLEHIAHVPDDLWKQFGPGAVGVGWDLSLAGLWRHLSTGAAVDPKEGAAWPQTDPGKDFVRRASGAWAEASILAGADAAEANQAAGRTTGFYTGQS